MQLNPFMLQAQKFTCSRAAKTMIAEASDLGIRPGVSPMGPLYDDACDAGITLVNSDSGVKTHWYISATDTGGENDDGEIAKWEYYPTSETLRRIPKLHGWKVVIYND